MSVRPVERDAGVAFTPTAHDQSGFCLLAVKEPKIHPTFLQSLKDGIVVMSMGADALPYLTTLGTLPASLVFFNFYRLNLVGCDGEDDYVIL